MKHNWEYKPFHEVATSITPNIKIDKSEYLVLGDVPIISQEESYISGYWNNIEDITLHEKPVVIFGDHSRVLKYVDFDFVVGADGVKILQPLDCIFPKYLYHFLKWYNVPSLGYSRHFKLIKEATYPVPPIEVQEQIVAELDAINELIEKNREVLRNLDALAQSLFYDTFGDPTTNSKGWEMKKLKEVAPHSISTLEPHSCNGKYWLLNLDQVESNSGRILNIQYFNYNEIGNSTTTFDNGNVLYSKLRPYLNKVVVPDNSGYCTTELIPLRPVSDIANRQYIAYALRTPQFVEYINAKTGGAKMPRVKMDIFWNFNIPVPPLALQETFAAQIEAIESQKAKVEAAIAELQTLLDSRMDYWFN